MRVLLQWMLPFLLSQWPVCNHHGLVQLSLGSIPTDFLDKCHVVSPFDRLSAGAGRRSLPGVLESTTGKGVP